MQKVCILVCLFISVSIGSEMRNPAPHQVAQQGEKESMSNAVLDLSKEFAGRRALVTGGSKGIGAAIAQRLLDGGATVAVAARNPHQQTPKNAIFIKGDIMTQEGAKKLVDESVE